MSRAIELRIALFACTLTVGLAVDAVKGVYQNPRYPGTGNQYGYNQTATSTNGLCYKTLPFDDAVNNSSRLPNTIPVPQGNDAPYITILDCCDGYKRNLTTNKCDPHCDGGCFGGECTGPNQCLCPQGWYPDKGACMPYCQRPCKRNAYCFSPNVCACMLGYEERAGECKPICPDGCQGGECVAPRVCQCRPGYVMNDLQQCVPVCEGGCPHGDCVSPGVCRCYDGWVNPPNERESCIAHCPGGCGVGGDCLSPNVCVCRPGYVRDSTGRCSPTTPVTQSPLSLCRNGCINGVCVGLDRCVCNSGYIHDPYDLSRCIYGGNQGGNQGSNQGGVQTGTQTHCDYPCVNGDCTGYNQCTCKYGYSLDPVDPTRSRCVPMCLSGCPNGVCTAPNFCLCNPGYKKDNSVKGSQRCVPI